MCTTTKYRPERRRCKDKIATKVKKIAMMQQRSIEQRSAVDSRRCLTNFKMLVRRCQQS